MKKCSIGFDRLVLILLYWLPLQDLIMGILYRYTHSSLYANILLYTKDILMIALFGMSFIRKQRKSIFNIVIILYFIWIVGYALCTYVISDISISSLVASTRGLLLCPVFIMVGSNIRCTEEFIDKIKEKYIKYLFFLAIIGIAEYFLDILIGTKGFWTNIVGIGELYNNIKNSPNTYLGLPGNFYGYSSAGFFTRKRLVSVWGNPLSSGYSFLIAAVYCVISFFNSVKKNNKRKKYFVYAMVFILAIILTYTRAIILGMFIALFLFFIYKNRNRVENIAILIIAFIFTAAVYLLVGGKDVLYRFLYDGSTKSHIDALLYNIKNVGVMGRGIGLFGATESVYFSVWGQVGFFGLVLFLFISYKAITTAYKKVPFYHDMALAVAISWVVFMITALISEQLMAYTTIAPSYVLLGVFQKKMKKGIND